MTSDVAREISKMVTDQMTRDFEHLRATIEELQKTMRQRDAAFELLGAYFDLHRHDPKARELQHKAERLLFWDEIVE